MLRVGLTGGIACGKTTIAQMLARRGAHVAFADEIAKSLLRTGTPTYDKVVQTFGRDILQSDGAIDRAKLATAAFGTDAMNSRIAELNQIIHPAVVAQQDQWMADIAKRNPNAVCVVEAALIYEAGAETHFDKIVMVTCGPEQKVERFAKRLSIPLETARAEVERRMRAQMPEAVKAGRADYVIDNSGSENATEQQVENIWRELQELASKSSS